VLDGPGRATAWDAVCHPSDKRANTGSSRYHTDKRANTGSSIHENNI
jgi:hypothetical protein